MCVLLFVCFVVLYVGVFVCLFVGVSLLGFCFVFVYK